MNTNTVELIQLVRDFPGLVLTGSRFFGTDGPNSDWDFMIQESEDLLLPVGFSEVYQSHYSLSDPSVAQVFYSNHLNCHIQIIREDWWEAKLEAQCILRNNDSLLGLSKEQAKRVWSSMLQATIKYTY